MLWSRLLWRNPAAAAQDPVSMQLVRERLTAGDYYATLDIFAADFRRMFANARYDLYYNRR